jgi:hypothetical protein
MMHPWPVSHRRPATLILLASIVVGCDAEAVKSSVPVHRLDEIVTSVVRLAGDGIARVELITQRGRRIQGALGPTGWFAAWWHDDPLVSATGYGAVGP